MLSVNNLYLRHIVLLIYADRVMAELIADVEQRWQQMDA